jgi:hypothetical protein
MLVASSMRSYAISSHAGYGLEMIRFVSAMFEDGRMDQPVRRATPLLFSLQPSSVRSRLQSLH